MAFTTFLLSKKKTSISRGGTAAGNSALQYTRALSLLFMLDVVPYCGFDTIPTWAAHNGMRLDSTSVSLPTSSLQNESILITLR